MGFWGDEVELGIDLTDGDCFLDEALERTSDFFKVSGSYFTIGGSGTFSGYYWASKGIFSNS